MRFSSTVYAVIDFLVVGLSDSLQSSKECVSPVLRMSLLVSGSLAYRTVCNHLRDAFLEYCVSVVSFLAVGLSDGLQSFKGCVSPVLTMPLSVSGSLAYRSVYDHLRDAFLEYCVSVVSFPVVGLLDGLQSSTGCVFQSTMYAVVSFLVIGLLDGLQSSKGCVSQVLYMQLSVSRSLADWTVYNHPRDLV